RIVSDSDSITIIDFKTGKREDKHYSQVKDYMIHIKEATDKPVEGYLFYVDEEEAVGISF
ncbi:MAG: hypothetical protein ABEH43_04020, partial [Flavobacteriales bacterium]